MSPAATGGRAVALDDGTPVHVVGPDDAPLLLWFGGSPSTGTVLEPVREAAGAHGLRVASWPRPGYAGRPRAPGRRVADAGEDAARALDRLEVSRALAVGYSGGAPHALAAAALLGERVVGVGLLAGLAPCDPAPRAGGGWSDGWWYDGMASPGALRAAAGGRAAREDHARHEEFDPAQFTAADWEALAGPWGVVGDDAQAASPGGQVPDGQIDDDLAFTTGWGIDLSDVRVPVVLAHGTADRVVPPAHAEALAVALLDASRLPVGDAGHIAVLHALPGVLDALLGPAR